MRACPYGPARHRSGKAPTSPINASEFVKPEVAASLVADCGFENVQPVFDDTLQEDVIKVLDVTVATEEQLTCVANASLGSHYYVVFPGPVDQTYQPLYWRIFRERGKADARAWLEQRGLLSRLPTFDPKQSETAAFARTLEGLCGPMAAGTLKPMKGFATFSDEALSPGRLDDETFLCLLNVAEVSGYPLGFIGNEAYPQDR